MIAIRRIDHVCLRVADVDEAAARWGVQFGLTLTERTADRASCAADTSRTASSWSPVSPGTTTPASSCVAACRSMTPART